MVLIVSAGIAEFERELIHERTSSGRAARTSARLRITTATLEGRVQRGRAALLSSDEVIAIGGAVPIIVDGRIVGALGVSGATAAEDAAIAETTVAQE